jgi:hypothetical protein
VERALSVAFLLAAGVALLVVARRGYVSGVLRAGSAYFRPYRPTRDDNPLAFHFFLALYFCGGLALLVLGILALVGGAPPMPLR